VSRWNGTSWQLVGGGTGPFVRALATYDDGSGPALFAGGHLTKAQSALVNHIAKWNGASWSGFPNSWVDGDVRALASHDDGSGPALFAGGLFSSAGGVAANKIARWNGTSWTPLGSGMTGNTSVNALAVYDDGGGPALYAGGSFTSAGGVPASCIAKWDGASWSALGSGMTGGLSTTSVSALTVFDDGSGPALYAGGNFTSAGGVAASRIARWDGSSWSALGS